MAGRRSRRRFCRNQASQPRRSIFGCDITRFFRFGCWHVRHGLRHRCHQWHDRHRRQAIRFQCERIHRRRPVRHGQRTPLAPDDWKQSIHGSNGVDANGDLPPVRAIADGETRHGASATGGQIDDAFRELRRRDARRDRCRDVGKSWRLDLFATADSRKTAW